MKVLIFLIIIQTFLTGQKENPRFDESFDPSVLKEPDIRLPIILRPNEPLPREFLPTQTDTIIDGFRVQVISTQDFNQANTLLSALLQEFGTEMYIIFDSPYYKLRVGNFRSRGSAEKAKQRIIELGHKTAWIIRTKVRRVPTKDRP